MRFRIFIAILLCWTLGNCERQEEKSVQVRIHGKWRDTSILAEISENLASQSPSLFWQFLDLVNENPIPKESSPRSLYDHGISLASQLQDPSDIGLLKLSLSLRMMSPRVEVYRQLSQKFRTEKCGKSSFLVYGKQVECYINMLNIRENDLSGEEIYPFDHIYPINSAAQRTIFIYGELGSRSLQKNIQDAKSLIEAVNNFRFVFRHMPSSASSTDPSHVFLSGYGVELALKNTEYKAVDNQNSSESLPENLHGLNFKTLINQHTDLRNELESLRENLEKIGEIVSLKGWQLKDLGYKTCEQMKMEGMEMEDIEELLQDFPIHSRTISHQPVNETIRKSIQHYQIKLQTAGIDIGQNVLAINGRIVTKTDIRTDIFSLIETVRQEKKIVDEIRKIGFDKEEVDYTKLMTLVDFSPVDMAGYAFDYRLAHPEFLNNIDITLGVYKSLRFLLQPFPPGQIRPISRNIFNVILFFDPFDSDENSASQKMFQKIQEYLNSGVYVRFGIVPIFDEKKHGMSVEEAVGTKKLDSVKLGIWRTKERVLDGIKTGNRFLLQSGFSLKPTALLNGYPLDTSSPESFDTSLAENIQKQTIRLQLLIYHRLLTDTVKIDEWWLKKANNPEVVMRISQRVTTAFNEKRFVEFDRDSSKLLADLRYFSETPGTGNQNSNITTWIITDFESITNRIYVAEILKKSILTRKNNRVALISNPKQPGKPCSFNLDDAFSLNELIGILESDPEADYCTSTVLPPSFLKRYGGKPGDSAIVSNGLIIGMVEEEEEKLEMEDLEFLEKLWMEKGAGKASTYLNMHFPSKDVSINFYSTVSKSDQKDVSRIQFDDFKSPQKTNLITFSPTNQKSPALTVTWIANPLSREGQQLVSIIKLLQKALKSIIKIEIILNPPSEISEMPIKRFYRFVGTEELEFDENGSVEHHFAHFSNLPQKQLLTMSLETNDAWMIEVKQAESDLDNILLEKSTGNVEAVYSLEHILAEGQSHTTTGDASAGMELELKSGDSQYDTIVMRNLGYFQLKASPGIWNLRLRNGASGDKYKIIKVDSKTVGKDIQVVVDSFTGKWTEIIVVEKEEKHDESSISQLINSAKDYFGSPTPSETINVFSLASGHLYERFMRIMMVSVMKNTKNPVKFWLLKNYLSPKFKETIPILARVYGFEYELVEYKWPKWLHQQTEKQRVMWGYKILFLDVLFPLNVDKIIFVDADQVVRADLLELMNLNLNGAPYGYVPFCENRKEMDGFRFWKSGYWETHLMGRRYHISALYVVDLKAFRRLSAGDRLRGRYDSLSSDPNSLSNLDQDLPNNMIHEVPIKSLPQEWLWCETWCDDQSKTTAKTIDLCNNPLTKEPKLNSAQRIIGEWKELDEEISNVIRSNGEESVEEKETQAVEKDEL